MGTEDRNRVSGRSWERQLKGCPNNQKEDSKLRLRLNGGRLKQKWLRTLVREISLATTRDSCTPWRGKRGERVCFYCSAFNFQLLCVAVFLLLGSFLCLNMFLVFSSRRRSLQLETLRKTSYYFRGDSGGTVRPSYNLSSHNLICDLFRYSARA